jgi:hypothetical protein
MWWPCHAALIVLHVGSCINGYSAPDTTCQQDWHASQHVCWHMQHFEVNSPLCVLECNLLEAASCSCVSDNCSGCNDYVRNFLHALGLVAPA